MAFLDPKERVMDIILTQYGRKLLSQGKLTAKYYRFFDDEVHYKTENISLPPETGITDHAILTEDGIELTTEDGMVLIFE